MLKWGQNGVKIILCANIVRKHKGFWHLKIGSIPLRSIFKKPWKSLISGVFCYLVERKNAVLNRFKPVQSGKIGVKIEAEII